MISRLILLMVLTLHPDILNINNVYFDHMVSQIYPSELQLNKANTSDTKAAFLDLHMSIFNDIVPRSTSYRFYTSQLIRFARTSSHVADFSTHNKLLIQKFLKQGYRYHKLGKTFS